MNDSRRNELMYAAYDIAQYSPDPSTQNGAVIVNPNGKMIGCGWNEFPVGVEYRPERWERPTKYSFIEHAERNAIFDAAKTTNSTRGSTMVCPWASCADCARAIVCSGITTLVRHHVNDDNGIWGDSIEIGDTIMKEGGVRIIEITTHFGDISPIRRNGKLWYP